MRSARIEPGYNLFSAEDNGSYEGAFDSITKQIREVEKRFKLDFIGGPYWKMAEDRKGHFVITQAAVLTPLEGA